MELCSPPKLTRLVDCLLQNKVDIQPSVCEGIEKTAPISVNGNVDEVSTEELVSLPALAGEVAVAQKHQIGELGKKQEILDRLKKKIDDVKAELAAASRKVYLTEDDVARKKTSCEQLEKDIEELIALEQALEKQVEVEKDKLQRGRETYNQYQQKMVAHAQEVELFELSTPIYQEIKKQKEENAKMKEELECLRRFGDSANLMALQAEIAYLKDKNESLEQSIISKQSELLKESEKQTQLKMDIETLHKRNKAQLTRLKRQLQEAVSRNRRWNDEACQLEQKIAQLRGRMEE